MLQSRTAQTSYGAAPSVAFNRQREEDGWLANVPVDGDVLQELAGGAVLQDDALRGNLEGDLRSFLPAGFSLSHKDDMQPLISLAFLFLIRSRIGVEIHQQTTVWTQIDPEDVNMSAVEQRKTRYAFIMKSITSFGFIGGFDALSEKPKCQ